MRFKIFLIFLSSFTVIFAVAPGRAKAASFQLTWVDNSQDEDGFNIERKLNTNGTFSLLATVGPDVTSFSDGNLADNTTYCYRVNALNSAGNSAYTNEACGTTPATSPSPSGNTISTNIANGAVLSGSSVVWTATPSGSPVRVEFFIDGALLWTENVSPYQFNGDPSGTLDTNALSNGSHQLKVRAIYSDNSTAEQTVTVTVSNGATPTPPPTPAFDFSLTNGGNKSVTQGQSVTNTITATLTAGSSQAVSFSTSGLPSGATGSYSTSTSCNPTCSRSLNIAAAGSTPTGTSSITVTSTGGGVTRTTSFTLTVNSSAGSSPTPTPPSSTVTATLLGQTGEDIAGTTSETPDGIKDVHIRLSGVQSTITRVRITDTGNGIWETPYNGWWIVAIRPQTDPSVVDLYFDFWQPSSSYTLNLTFANGSTQTIQTSSAATPTPPPPVASTITATLLGQTGEEIAGTTSETPDGIKDVHIRLSGVQSTITRVKITDTGNGIWETPYNNQGNWIVAIRPQTDPSVVDLYFDFWQPSSSYTLNLTFANGSTQTIQTSTPLSAASFGSGTLVTLAAGSAFAGSSGTGCTNSAATMDTSKSCTATFQTNQLSTKIGVFRPDTGEWFLDRSGNGQWDDCAVDACISLFGQPGDLPVIGSWSGAGTSNIGTFNQTRGIWQLDRNGNGQWDGCALDTCIGLFGQPGELPVTREISGFNGTIIGTFQPQHGRWKFDLNGNNRFDDCSIDECDENFGTLGDVPVVGDWNGSGTEDIGVFRPSTGDWYLDANGNGQWDGCRLDKCLGQFGVDGDVPVVGDWSGTGQVRIGVFRPSTGDWFLDMNGNGKFDGCAVDACLGPFGIPGDLPVVGNW